jgi:hypothetical protein
MPLSKPRLKGTLKTDIIALNTLMKVSPLSDDDYADKLAELIANKVIDEITVNATVPTGITVQVNTLTGTGSTNGTGRVS